MAQITGAERDALLRKLLLKRSQRAKRFPVSLSQRSLWVADQLSPGNSSYNIPTALRLEGNLNRAALEQSLTEIVRRHEALRTHFEVEAEEPVQVVSDPTPFKFDCFDISHLSESAREQEARRLAEEEAQRPFDLGKGPLFRGSLVRISAADHLLLFTMHHIISDAWSMGVLVQEVGVLYSAYSKGEAHGLEDLTLQYPDVAQWQRKQLAGEGLDRLIGYWRETLASLPTLELATDFTRPAAPQYRGGSVKRLLPRSLVEGVHALSSEAGATPFMTYLAAFSILLHRHSGQSDIAIGTAVANRKRKEMESLIGFFVNVLVLRARVSVEEDFSTFLGRIREMALSAYEHQEAPFEVLVDALAPARRLSHSPLFQVAMALQNTNKTALSLPDLRVRMQEYQNPNTRYDLELHLSETDMGLWCGFSFRADLFSQARIERMAEEFEVLLAGIIAKPEAPVTSLPFLAEREAQQMIHAWNETEMDYPSEACWQHFIEAQVKLRPEAMAVCHEGQSLSYQDLNVRANQLAHYLQAQGVRSEKIVGLALLRGIDLVVATLAVLKSGGAFLPLDPAYPADRLAYMLEDAQVACVISTTDLADHFPSFTAPLICLDQDQERIAQHPQENPGSGVNSRSLAYVIYTSGSTGRPKGSLLEHRGVVNLASWQRSFFKLSPSDRVLQLSSPCFDVYVWELAMALCSGACLHIAPKSATTSMEDLGAMLREEAITAATILPAMLRLLETEGLESLRLLITGAEVVDLEVTRKWAPGRLFYNAYGPTEYTVCTCLRPCSGEEEENPPIGKPIGNTRLYVLDAYGQQTPLGVPGELCIGGAQLARGYLNAPELSREKFVSDPFREGERLYHTGDWVRYTEEGEIEFLGRIDQQVKLRGYRIELGEIEVALKKHAAVTDAVLILREDSPGNRQLVAYYQSSEAGGVEVSALRSFLGSLLPDYMIPSAFIFMASFPLLPNAKVDRKSLPAPEYKKEDRAAAYVAPTSAAEEKLAALWESVLGVAGIGVQDNFFELGGDSILAIQIAARARKAGWRLDPRDLFQHQSVAALAAVLEEDSVIAFSQDEVAGDVLLTPIQRWFFEQALEAPNHFNQAVMVQLKKALRPEILETVLAALMRHHDVLRMRFQRTDCGWTQQCMAAEEGPPLRCFDFAGLGEKTLVEAIEEEAKTAQTSLDIVKGPIWRVLYFDCGPARPARLLFVIHHLVVDGVSWRILLEDLEQACLQALRGEDIAFQDKTMSFQAWSERLSKHAASAELAAAYWTSAERYQDVAPIPKDRAGEQENTIASAVSYTVSFSEEETRVLLQELPERYESQVNEVLLTALLQAFRSWTGSSKLLLDMEGHGRERFESGLDVSRTVGWFTSLYPVLLESDQNPLSTLEGVKKDLRAVPDHGLSYALLRYLHPDEAQRVLLAKQGRAEVIFNYLGQLGQVFAGSECFEVAQESTGASMDPAARRFYAIEVSGRVFEGCLQVRWQYSEAMHCRESIEGVADSFAACLRDLLSLEGPRSRFEDAELDEEDLTALMKRLGQEDC